MESEEAGSMAPNKPRVFVSHSHADRELARKLIDQLRKHDIQVQAADEMPHDKDRTCVDRAIMAADAVVILIGPNDEPEEPQLREWRIALEESWASPEKRLIPVLLDDAKTPGFLADRIAFRVKLRKEGPDFSKLVRALSDPRRIRRSVRIDKEHLRQRKERLSYIGKAAASLKTG